MATGFLTPDGRLRVFSDLGVVLPGAKLHTYVAGTPSTPLATYSDVDLAVGHENTNPVVASAGGLFGPIYLTPGVAYKLVLTDAADVAVWSQDNVAMPGTIAAGSGITLVTAGGVTTISASGPSGLNAFRLTLESGVPISTTDQTAKTTLYCTPYLGNRIDLYDAAGVSTTLTSAQVSIAIPATTSQLYDVFAYNNAGVVTLELLAWTNDTTRATAIVTTTTGVYTKSGDLTRRYLGSVRTTAVSGQTEDSAAKRYVWNYYNRVERVLRVLEATATWVYAVNTWRQTRATATNQLDVVVGVAEAPISVTALSGAFATGATSLWPGVAIGEDSTTTPSPSGLLGVIFVNATAAGSDIFEVNVTASLITIPAAGRHTYVWLENTLNGNSLTFWGTSATRGQTGIQGRMAG